MQWIKASDWFPEGIKNVKCTSNISGQEMRGVGLFNSETNFIIRFLNGSTFNYHEITRSEIEWLDETAALPVNGVDKELASKAWDAAIRSCDNNTFGDNVIHRYDVINQDKENYISSLPVNVGYSREDMRNCFNKGIEIGSNDFMPPPDIKLFNEYIASLPAPVDPTTTHSTP